MVEIGHAIIYGLVAFGFFTFIAVLSWIDYKKSQTSKDKKVDPIQKGVILSFLLIGVLFLAEAVGFFEKGWMQKHWWLMILIVITIISVYMFVAVKKQPMSYEKQKEIVRKIIASEYEADSYIGDANVHFLKVYKLTVEGESDETRGEVGNFLVEVKAEDLIKIWIQINVYTGQLLHIQISPPVLLENRLLGAESPKKDMLGEQFEDNKPNLKDGTPAEG